jgi:hypothetical protein
VDVTQARRQVRLGLAAVKDRHFMPTFGETTHDVWSDELRAAEYKYSHLPPHPVT